MGGTSAAIGSRIANTGAVASSSISSTVQFPLHKSRLLSEPADVFCINIYTSPGACNAATLFAAMALLGGGRGVSVGPIWRR
ncbi:hypothetical protein ABNQ38_37015 (plasmid) [Azospirillum sp. A29]|uniref:hypothetical protein n=1 Tax=Azospirillum sp. A29 TaxID=3160606 RepID=UPI00366F7584